MEGARDRKVGAGDEPAAFARDADAVVRLDDRTNNKGHATKDRQA
jgi:hypothetical protein